MDWLKQVFEVCETLRIASTRIGWLFVCFCVFFSVLSRADGIRVSLSRKLGGIRPEWALDNVCALVEDVTYYIAYLHNLSTKFCCSTISV